jgi:hypothetical protein
MSSEPTGSRSSAVDPHDPGVSSWVGWIAFAAVTMVVLGALHLVQGTVVLVGGEDLVGGSHEPALDLSSSAWAWFEVMTGGVVVLAGVCVFAGQKWARGVGVLMAVISAVGTFAGLPVDPGRSLLLIALDLVLILALTVHGRDITPEKPA